MTQPFPLKPKFNFFSSICTFQGQESQILSSINQMENKPKAEDNVEESSALSANWGERIEGQYQRIKEHAETYPYVWGSYMLVYGGFGLWLAYRWRRLRQTEDRVRVLQERLRKLVEPEKTSPSAAVTGLSEKNSTSLLSNKLPPSDDKAAN